MYSRRATPAGFASTNLNLVSVVPSNGFAGSIGLADVVSRHHFLFVVKRFSERKVFRFPERGGMISRRDLMVALIAATCTAGAFAAADGLPLIGSAVFDWNAVPAKANRFGIGAFVFQDAHGDAGAIGGPRHDFESGKVPASAASTPE